MFRVIRKLISALSAASIILVVLGAQIPLDQIISYLKQGTIVDQLYQEFKTGKVVDKFFTPAHAAHGPRVRTVTFFAGQHASATLANQNQKQNFPTQTFQLAESGVDIMDAYVEVSAQIGGITATTYGSSFIYFDMCVPTCTPSTVAFTTTAGLGTNSREAQTIRFRAAVTSEAEIAAYTGSGANRTFQVSYCFGTSTSCSGTTSAQIQGANAKLVVTYTYDHTSATQTNTVLYPLESNTTGPVGSRTAAQAACTVDSNCPTFSYNAEIPEIGTQIAQFFHLQTSVNANSSTDWQTISDIGGNPGGTNTSAIFFEEGLTNNGGWINVMQSGISGYANNSAQVLEMSTNGSNAYTLGGENYVTYTYSNAAATKTKTIVYPVGEVTTASNTTKSALTGPTVYFPETGVTVKKAWFRVHTSMGGNTTASNLSVTTKVGTRSETSATAYALAADTQGISDDGYLIHIIPSADYTELAAATASSGKTVQMTSQWSTARGAVSAELVITYTYTSDSAGYMVSQQLFAGQQTAAPATTYTTGTGAINPAIPETSGVTIRGASLMGNWKAGAQGTANATLGVNLTTSTCSATQTSTAITDNELNRMMLWKSISGVVTTNDAQTYTFCTATNETAVASGSLIITYQYDAPVSSAVTATATGTQTASVVANTSDFYIGAAFRFQQDTGTTDTITALTLSETSGTFNANTNGSNATIRYETENAGTCTYDGSETVAKTGVSFNASDQAIFTTLSSNIPLTLSPNFTCVYLTFTVSDNAVGGQTIEIQLTASSDFTLSGGSSKAGTYPLQLSGTTTVANPTVNIAAIGTQATTITRGATNQYVGGAFSLTMATSTTRTLTSFAVNDNGTVNANLHLNNVKLFYDTDGTYAGNETQLGTTQSFNASEQATFGSLSLNLTTTTTYIYVVLDANTSATSGQTIEIRIAASGNVVGTNLTISGTFPLDLSGTTTIQDPTLTVSVAGTQATNLDSGTTNQHIGGGSTAAFRLQIGGGSATVSSVKITDTGTVTFTGLTSPRLYYENASTCTYNGNETNVTGTYAGEAVTFTLSAVSIGVTPNYTCLYYVANLDATNTVGGQTIILAIANPSTDVVISGATNSDTVSKNFASTTTIRPNVTSVTNATDGALTDGAREGQTLTIAGAGFGTTCNTGTGNKVSIGSDDLSCTGATFTNTSISIPLAASFPDTNNGGSAASGLLVTIGNTADDARTTWYVYPTITSLTVPTATADAAREYSASDNDGLITINGNHFGSAPTGGYVRILGCDSSTCSSPSGSATIHTGSTCDSGDPSPGDGWSPTCIRVRIPTVIANNVYTGAITLQQGTGSGNKTHSYSSLRILPRITGFSPTTPAPGDAVQVQGDHFCQSGTCPTGTVGTDADTSNAPAFSTNDRITFTSSQIATYWGANWSHAGTPNTADTQVPSAATSGGVVLRSGGYDSNAQSITIASNIPSDAVEANLGQFKDSGFTESIAVAGGNNATTVYLRITGMTAQTSGGTLYPQVEVKPVGTPFDGTGITEGSGVAGPGPTTGSVTVSGLTANTSYHWRARVCHNKGGAHNSTCTGAGDYASASWTTFGGNPSGDGIIGEGSPANTDFYIDTTPPLTNISCVNNPSGTDLQATTATIRWSPSDGGFSTQYTKQVKYSTNSSLTGATCYPGASCGDQSTYSSSPLDVTLNNLIPNTTYYYRVLSHDRAGNLAEEPSTPCSFTTNKGKVVTIEQWISQETGQTASGTLLVRPFTVAINENNVSLVSAIIEINGVSSNSSPLNQVMYIILKQGTVGAPLPSGYAQYTIDSTGTTTPFKISFDAKNPSQAPTSCGGCYAMATDITGSGSYSYTLYMQPNNATVSILSAKLILTYQYAE